MLPGPDPTGRVVGGRYRLTRVLGQGGMGVVYEAWQEDLGRSVAVKLMTQASPEALARFQREARAAAALGHPHIAQIFDFQSLPGEAPFLVMELVAGQSLRDLVRARGPLPEARVAKLGVQVLSALDAAHRAGILHRDVKPANVLVTASPTLGEMAKVLDFGIAKLTSTDAAPITQHGSIVGTLAYMSPEQARGEELDARSDVYSLSATLFFACTGERPLQVGEATETLQALLAGRVRRVADVRPGLDPALSAIIERGLAPDRQQRFGSAWEMGQALGQWLERGSAPRFDAPAPPSLASGTWSPGGPHAVAMPSANVPAPGKRSGSGVFLGAGMVGLGLLGIVGVAGAAAAYFYFAGEEEPPSATPAASAASAGGARPPGQPAASVAMGEPSEMATGKVRGAAPTPREGAPAPSPAGAPAATSPSSTPTPSARAPAEPKATGPGGPSAACNAKSDCGGLAACEDGQCVCHHTECGAACVDTHRDPKHCGGCNQACDPGEFCMTSSCTSCNNNFMAVCNGKCVVIAGDLFNCGGCGIRCKAGQICKNGTCT